MTRRPRSTSYARRPRDFDYMGWIKTQPCALVAADLRGHEWFTPCDGEVQADHAGDIGVRGLGMKAPDATCIPLCRKHHEERTDRRGYFRAMDTLRMREWCEAIVAMYRARYLRNNPLG